MESRQTDSYWELVADNTRLTGELKTAKACEAAARELIKMRDKKFIATEIRAAKLERSTIGEFLKSARDIKFTGVKNGVAMQWLSSSGWQFITLKNASINAAEEQ
jgi:hypothetical protein